MDSGDKEELRKRAPRHLAMTFDGATRNMPPGTWSVIEGACPAESIVLTLPERDALLTYIDYLEAELGECGERRAVTARIRNAP